MLILALLLSIIFLILSLIHINWVFGGTFGFDASLPTNEEGQRMLNPKPIDSAIVGLGLLLFSVFYFLKANLIDITLSSWVFTYFGWIIPSIFLLRAIGEFKYLGFFKTVKSTAFARYDTRLYAPLCLCIALLGYMLKFWY
ncbi:DUF3995 domain-containing protein [uncultured Psychroserpens sp.]|uniref:DUF3995 domain-containing protein n=1 Tax=uncultured Psychroserpens sp. TaxID=255436 RepID=UPI002610CEC6|nr:DUF3995 domain-containing protein [uncultured Psychroserpens sp.]